MALNLLSGSLQGVTVKLEELQLRQQLSLRIIKAQEEERLRVAREIHDGPAQSMANVVLRAEICEKLMNVEPEKVKAELQDLKTMVKESLQEVRKIIFDLRPMALDDLGIVPTLRRFIAEIQKRGDRDISIELIVLGGEAQRMSGVLEVAVFRLVQESLNNILKHASANRAVIRLEILPQQVNVSVSDDGCGFNTDGILQNRQVECYGLLGMRERVDLLDGQMKVSSSPGKGTEIHISIPVKE
jgi:two-component system sensor histidine kinase DegS